MCDPESFNKLGVKTESHVIDPMYAAACVNLQKALGVAFKVLRDAVRPTCVLHSGDFSELDELHDLGYVGPSKSLQSLYCRIFRTT